MESCEERRGLTRACSRRAGRVPSSAQALRADGEQRTAESVEREPYRFAAEAQCR